MRFHDMLPGTYVIRTRELPSARMLSGNICYVEGNAADRISLRLTDDCTPVGNVFTLGADADDGHWYDVSELVLEANSCVMPVGDRVMFNSPVTSSYRNFVGLGNIAPYVGEDAEGKICIVGESKDGTTIFAKTGYYVVGVDSNGYAIAYSGFCDYVESGETSRKQLRVLNFNGSNRGFYPAHLIVSACCKAYDEDCALASGYTETIKMETAPSSIEATYSDVHDVGFVNRLSLE